MTSLKDSSFALTDYAKLLQQFLDREVPARILEIGAGPNPSLTEQQIKQATYHLNDFSKEELEKGKNDFIKIPGNFAELKNLDQYDMIISKMVLEHVKHPSAFHQKILEHLNPGGIAIHYFATLYSLPAVVNQFLPEFLSSRLLNWAQKRDEALESKFPAYYRWCRGPLKRNHLKFTDLGFEIMEHHGYLGHGYLSSKPKLWPLEKSYNKFLLKLNAPIFCSNAILILRKPA